MGTRPCYCCLQYHSCSYLCSQQHLYVMLKKRASPSTSRNSASFTSTSACSRTRGSMNPTCVAGGITRGLQEDYKRPTDWHVLLQLSCPR
eukprot:scaffold269657_cov21-Tisochrysis_lutea.AAC.1